MPANMPVAMCQRLVEGVAKQCSVAPPVASTTPNFDALAASLSAQGNAISSQANYLTFATLALGLIAIFLAIGWGIVVKVWAERAARDAVNEWMEGRGVQVIADNVAKIMPDRVDGGPGASSGLTQEQQANELSADK